MDNTSQALVLYIELIRNLEINANTLTKGDFGPLSIIKNTITLVCNASTPVFFSVIFQTFWKVMPFCSRIVDGVPRSYVYFIKGDIVQCH